MWRSTERASLEKKPSMRLSHDPCVGVKVKVKRPMGCAASQGHEKPAVVLRLRAVSAETHADGSNGGILLDDVREGWRRTASANEMSCAASEVPMMSPVSCCGKKPFGMTAKR